MKKFKTVLICGAFFFLIGSGPLFPTSAAAASYKYVDRNGTIHFTDRYESIPQEYRNQVKTLREDSTPEPPAPLTEVKEKSREGEPAAGERAGKVQESGQKETRAIEERERDLEAKKRKAVEEKEKRIKDLQAQIEEKRKHQHSLRTSWMVQDRNTTIKLNQEIALLERQIKLIQEEIEEGK